eukprot:TRINITY_DN7779_c0_g1_i8.p4 TRINITY_DN7779_c0_g1~~TRINITY_DN7779_c0_g1_i8.p4  ORF type:complete len:126 (-),score=15.36 TRINITY_DN7779_c0_g1_i8:126-503(-)
MYRVSSGIELVFLLLVQKSFFRKLVEFMSSGPISVLLLEKENAVAEWREFIGPTDPSTAKDEAPNSLRAQFGEDKTRNGLHGSDSIKSADREIRYFFPEYFNQIQESCKESTIKQEDNDEYHEEL